MRNTGSLLVFLALVLGGGIAIGVVTAPGDWYAGLVKPSFNPPNWIFAPVWTALYVCIAVAGWRMWGVARDSLAMRAWWAQMALNFAWSPIFFAAHWMALALAVIVLMFIAIAVFIGAAWGRDRVAALLFLPYLAWVGFASLLNGALLWLNPG